MFDKKLIINFSKTKDFECIDYYFKYTVRKAIKAALLHEEFPHDVNVEITFCDNAYIKSLNKEFRGKNSATDVLSFPLYDFTAGDEAFIIPQNGEPVLDVCGVVAEAVCRLKAYMVYESRCADFGDKFFF